MAASAAGRLLLLRDGTRRGGDGAAGRDLAGMGGAVRRAGTGGGGIETPVVLHGRGTTLKIF